MHHPNHYLLLAVIMVLCMCVSAVSFLTGRHVESENNENGEYWESAPYPIHFYDEESLYYVRGTFVNGKVENWETHIDRQRPGGSERSYLAFTAVRLANETRTGPVFKDKFSYRNYFFNNEIGDLSNLKVGHNYTFFYWYGDVGFYPGYTKRYYDYSFVYRIEEENGELLYKQDDRVLPKEVRQKVGDYQWEK